MINAACFPVSKELIKQSLHMPDNCDIIGVEWDFVSDCLRMYVECPDLAAIEYGSRVPEICPIIKTTNIDDNRAYEWDWNIKK